MPELLAGDTGSGIESGRKRPELPAFQAVPGFSLSDIAVGASRRYGAGVNPPTARTGRRSGQRAIRAVGVPARCIFTMAGPPSGPRGGPVCLSRQLTMAPDANDHGYARLTMARAGLTMARGRLNGHLRSESRCRLLCDTAAPECRNPGENGSELPDSAGGASAGGGDPCPIRRACRRSLPPRARLSLRRGRRERPCCPPFRCPGRWGRRSCQATSRRRGCRGRSCRATPRCPGSTAGGRSGGSRRARVGRAAEARRRCFPASGGSAPEAGAIRVSRSMFRKGGHAEPAGAWSSSFRWRPAGRASARRA